MKTRRHHNNDGRTQIKRGKTQRDVEKWRKIYIRMRRTAGGGMA
jgi:hypothetical protein